MRNTFPRSGGRCIELTAHGAPDVLSLTHKAIPEPRPKELRIRVKTAGLAFADIKMRHGVYPGAPK